MADGVWQDGAPGDKVLIAGLGNPGRRYAFTRHNAGFIALAALRQRLQLPPFRECGVSGASADRTSGTVGEHAVVLLRPLELMNLSGQPVARELRRQMLTPEDLIVVHDDLDLPAGRLRLRVGGGTGGHNGLQSIVEALGSAGFARVRIGIGRIPGRSSADYVLEELAPEGEAMETLLSAAEEAAEAIEVLLSKGLSVAQQIFHTKPTTETSDLRSTV
ncbi:MAG: aminoacyl-tRNA hydrolase [Candidatus Schekmanbacteria bacterium]|nr:aminoacyl-tRNA hydrolase [Candidatus Schekmanbacteria bacterium]